MRQSLREFLDYGSEPLAVRPPIHEQRPSYERAPGRQAPCLNGRDGQYPHVELEWTSLASQSMLDGPHNLTLEQPALARRREGDELVLASLAPDPCRLVVHPEKSLQFRRSGEPHKLGVQVSQRPVEK